MEEGKSCRKVCVTGGSGFIGSWLVKKLLEKGYIVHATLRNLHDESKVGLLKSFPGSDTRLVLIKADIYNPDEFEAAIHGCESVLHVATPTQHTENDKYKSTTEAAVEGVKIIVRSCVRSGTVKRLVYTATVMAASPLKDDGSGYKDTMDETCWTSTHHAFLYNNDFVRAYTESKTLAEKEILSYINEQPEGGMDIVSLGVALVGGDTLLPYTPGSVAACISQITNKEFDSQALRLLKELLGKIPIVHIQDVCHAHIFCIEKIPSFRGRFLCASDYICPADIAKYYQENYPEFHLKQEHLDGARTEIKWGSTKLVDLGFQYKCDTKKILDDSLNCARRMGDL